MTRWRQSKLRGVVLVFAAFATASCAVVAGLDSDAFATRSAVEPGDAEPIADATNLLDGGAGPESCQLDGEWGEPALLPGFDSALDASKVAEESVREGPDGCLYWTLTVPGSVPKLYRACPGGSLEPIVVEGENVLVTPPFRHATFVPNTAQVVFSGVVLLDAAPDSSTDLDILVADIGGKTFRNPRRFDAASTVSNAVNDTALDDIDPFVDGDGNLTFVRVTPPTLEAGAISEIRRASGPAFDTSTPVPVIAPVSDGAVPTFASIVALPLLAPDGFLYVSLVRTGTDVLTLHRGKLTTNGLESVTELPVARSFVRSFAVGVSRSGCSLYLRAQTTDDPTDRVYVLRKPAKAP